MDNHQFQKACDNTRKLLTDNGAREVTPCRVTDKPWVTEHLVWMLETASAMYLTKAEKANRWLGYVQGCMACKGYSLEALKRANMPENEQFDGDRI